MQKKNSAAQAWIEAMRLRTLPVGVAGVIAGTAVAVWHHGFSWLPMAICLLFAVAAQIASNFANEYYDYRNGLDKKGRDGFRRGVTEGDISPQAMKKATYALLAADTLLGCSLIIWGGWWLVPVGASIAVFALAYSAGPFPLSHHGLGDIAVIVFFGFVPVLFSQYVQTGVFYTDFASIGTALAVGLMAANVLIVNNYRDCDDDRAVGKHTTVVILGRKTMATVYLINGVVAFGCLAAATTYAPMWTVAGWIAAMTWHLINWTQMKNLYGSYLNNILKTTSILLLITAIYLLLVMSVFPK